MELREKNAMDESRSTQDQMPRLVLASLCKYTLMRLQRWKSPSFAGFNLVETE
jgi:hypothetical protein